MITEVSLSSCWNVQDSLQTEPPILWMLHLRGHGWVQAEHTLTHTLIWGVFGTQKEHLLWQWTSVTERQKQKVLQVTGLKRFLVKRQTKQNTPQQSLSPWTPSRDGHHDWSQLQCHRKYQNQEQHTLQHYSTSRYDIQSHLRLCSQNCDTRDYTEQKEFPSGGQQANPLLQMEWPSQLWPQQYKTATMLYAGFQTEYLVYL